MAILRHDPPFHPYATKKSLARWESIWEEHTSWTGTAYPSNTSFLTDLADSYSPLLCPTPNVLPFQVAVQYFQSLHNYRPALSPTQEAAVARLRTLHALDASGQWVGDIAMKIFPDLDSLLFESRLGGNVNLEYGTGQTNPEISQQCAMVSAPGDWNHEYGIGKRIVILLNADRMLLDGRRTLRDLIAALVHEMTHAYLMLAVGHVEGQVVSDVHTVEFKQCIDALNMTLTPYTGFISLHQEPRSWRS